MLYLALAAVLLTAAPMDFDDQFTGRTMRFDYFHTGIATEEHISLDAFRIEGEWPGSRTQLIDPTGLGKYQVEMRDLESQQVLYTRGFASIYGEWETTGEAKRAWRSIHESQRFPEPRGPVQLVLKKRQPDGSFREVFARLVDPTSRFVDRSPIPARGEVVRITDDEQVVAVRLNAVLREAAARAAPGGL